MTEHPLQPFSPAYFTGEESNLFGYSKENLAGAGALRGERRQSPVLISRPLEEGESEVVRLRDLIRFFRMPADFLLSRRLGVRLEDDAEEMEDREPMALDALTRFGAGEYLLARKREGASSEELYRVLKAGGQFPLGTPGRCAFEALDGDTDLLLRELGSGGEGLPDLPVELDINGVRVVGTIDSLSPSGRMVATYGKLNEKRKLDLWITHLLLNAAAPSACPPNSLLMGRSGKKIERIGFGPIESPVELLSDLLEIYRMGLTVPLPFFPIASRAYASAFLEAGGTPDFKTLFENHGKFFCNQPGLSGGVAAPGHPAFIRGRKPPED